MIIQEAPRRLVEMGLFIGRDLRVIRRKGYLYQVRVGSIDLVIDKDLYDQIVFVQVT